MKSINRKLLPALVCVVFAFSIQGAFAQDDEAERAREQQRQLGEQEHQRQEEQQQHWVKETRDEFVNTDREMARKTLDSFARPVTRIEREFMLAVPHFREAVTTYRDALSLESSLKESVKGMDRFVDLFREYFKATHVDLPILDKTEFNSFSKKELIWETLTTAERVDGDLRLALKQLREANDTNTLSIETVLFMRDLHGEVLRLELLLAKVK